jgi:hypothetical protein
MALARLLRDVPLVIPDLVRAFYSRDQASAAALPSAGPAGPTWLP